MSYSASISFSKIKENEIEDLFREFKKYLITKFDHIAKDEFIYCPMAKGLNFETISKYDNYLNYTYDYPNIQEQNEYWMSRIFSFRWFYEKDWELLGVYGVPTCCRNFFDGTVYFQNSTDQDYDLKEWAGIEVFENIYRNYESGKKDKEIIKSYLDDGFTEDDLSDMIYYRKSGAYKEIWDKISWTLYQDDKAIYISFFNYYDSHPRLKFLNSCFNYTKDFFKE